MAMYVKILVNVSALPLAPIGQRLWGGTCQLFGHLVPIGDSQVRELSCWDEGRVKRQNLVYSDVFWCILIIFPIRIDISGVCTTPFSDKPKCSHWELCRLFSSACVSLPCPIVSGRQHVSIIWWHGRKANTRPERMQIHVGIETYQGYILV